MTQSDDRGLSLVVVSILSSLALFLCLQGVGLWYAGGVFEYPLDDVYIHLAMAEQIGAGGYGVNAGEYASAASSPLYPLLILPVVSPEFQRFLPLFWNVVGLILSAWIWAKILSEAGFSTTRFRPSGYALAAIGPAAFLTVTTAFLGMEHVLHAAASLAIVLGLFRHLNGDAGKLLLLTGIFLAPLLRLEGLALALLASGVLLYCGARRLAVIAALLTAVPFLGFTLFLAGLGLDPLPGSVLAKMSIGSSNDLGALAKFVTKFQGNLAAKGGWILAFTSLAVLAMGAGKNPSGNSRLRILAITVFLAGFTHLFAARMGWMFRYEHYALAVACGGFVIFVPGATAGLSRVVANTVALVPFAALLVSYGPAVPGLMVINPRAIHAQQAQMASYAQDHLSAAVAVNDLGRVAWNNPNYVLDLWGLASQEARKIRHNDPAPGWAGPLVDARNVPMAMIYENWLSDAVGEDWVKVGDLSLTERRGFLGGFRVAFFATAPVHVPQVLDALQSWVPTLPEMAYFTYAEVPK